MDVLSVISPYFAAISQDEIYNHYAELASAVDLPVVMYNMPARTGNNINPDTVARLSKVPGIVGVKDSSGNFDNMKQYIELTDPETFSVLSGNDALILWNLLAGGSGGITAVANIYPEVMVSIYQYFLAGDLEAAKKAQDSIRPIRNCFKFGNPNTVTKTAARIAGNPVGPCRRPFSSSQRRCRRQDQGDRGSRSYPRHEVISPYPQAQQQPRMPAICLVAGIL